MPVSGCTCVCLPRVSKRGSHRASHRNERTTNLLEHFVDVRGVRVRARLATTLLVAARRAARAKVFGRFSERDPARQQAKALRVSERNAHDAQQPHTQDTLRTRPSWCPSFRLCEPFGFVGCGCVAERGALAVFRGFRFRASPSQPRKSAHFFNFGALHDATTPQKQNTMSGRGKAASGAKAKAASGAKKATKSNSRR